MTRVKQSITQRTGLRHKVRWVLITGRCFFKNGLLFLVGSIYIGLPFTSLLHTISLLADTFNRLLLLKALNGSSYLL